MGEEGCKINARFSGEECMGRRGIMLVPWNMGRQGDGEEWLCLWGLVNLPLSGPIYRTGGLSEY